MERRVVVTGLGAVTPLGNDVKSTWENMIAGKNGIDFVTAFDIGSFKAKLAGEVKGFDPALYMPKGDVRKTDLYAQYALAAAVQAVEDSKIEGTVEPDRMGVYIGSGIGGIHTLVAEHAKGMEKGWNRISPYFVPMMISNIASGTVAIRYNAPGAEYCGRHGVRHVHEQHRRGVSRRPSRLCRRDDRRRQRGGDQRDLFRRVHQLSGALAERR